MLTGRMKAGLAPMMRLSASSTRHISSWTAIHATGVLLCGDEGDERDRGRRTLIPGQRREILVCPGVAPDLVSGCKRARARVNSSVIQSGW